LDCLKKLNGDYEWYLIKPAKDLVESLIEYDKLFKLSKQSLIRSLNDNFEQHHGIQVVAAWVSENEVLLDYCINRVKNSKCCACLAAREQY